MALTKKTKSLFLDKAHPNAPYSESILQGSLDKIFEVTLMDDNVPEEVDSNAKVTVIVLYNPRIEYDKFVKDGSYVLKPDDTGYDVTITTGKIQIPLHEGMVTYAGKNQLVLLVDNGFTSYSYQIDFMVDRNNAYTEQSLPDNLPSYTNLQKQVTDLITKTSNQENQINSLNTSVSSKANDDLSNVGDFSTIPEGGLLMKSGGTIKHSDITIQGDQLMATDKVFNVKEVKTAPNTISIGEAIKLKENGGALEIETQTVGKRWLVLDYENDPVNGTKKPVYYARAAKEQITIQSTNTSNMVISSSVDFGRPQFDRQIQAIYFDFITAVKNFRMKITVNNKDLFFYPSKRAYEGLDKGLDMSVGVNKIDFIPNFSNVTEYASTITFIADGPINVKGNGTLPWYKLDLNRITRHKILVDGDAGTETPEEMARGLEALEFSKKLSYKDGLKDKPVLPVATTDFEDMPKSLVGMAGKMLQVNAVEEGYELIDKPTGGVVDQDTLSFRHSLAIKAINKSGATINDRTFVMLSPKANGKFNMIPITKQTKYSGEIIGIVESQVLADAEGQVNLITNYQTGVTGVSEGVAAYVGFTDVNPSSDNIDIGTKDNLAVIFGKCGVFGGVNNIGEFMANFNSFEVQSYYAVESHHDADIDYHDDLPGVIDKEALFVYLNDDITSQAGIVEQQLPQLSTVEKGMQIYVNNKSASPLAKIRLLAVGTDKIEGASTYEIAGGKKMLFIATTNGWIKFYDSTSSGGGADPDQVAANTAELNRLRTQIKDSLLPTYVFRDRGVPGSLNTGYKAYYIHSIVLPDNNQVLNLPQGLADGTILSIENNDRAKYLSLRPASGETINSNTGLYQCGHDTLNFFVKNNDDWTLAYGGIFPNNLTALKSTIQALLPNELNTIDEISAQLKDRLHTFREIQNEFSSQLHTLDAIEADMISKGFSKGYSVGYGTLDVSTPPQDLNWVTAHVAPNAEFIVPATNQGNKYLAIYMPVFLSPLVSEIKINNVVKEKSESKVYNNDLEYTVFVLDDQIDTSTNNRVSINFASSSASGSGIELDDGTTNVAGVTKINLSGAYLENSDPKNINLKCVTSWETLNGMGGGNVNRVLVEDPLQVYMDPNNKPGEEDRVIFAVKHDYFELRKPPGYLAYLSEDEEIIGRIKANEAGVRQAPIWFDDIIVSSDGLLNTDKTNKAYAIQDYTEDDPNVTGGIPTLIAFRAAMKGKAPNDGFVELLLKKTDEGTPTQDGDYLLNPEGNPIGLRKQYKSGDDLGVLDLMTIYMAKEQVKFQCILEHNFVDDGVMLEDRTEGASGIMIQALGGDYSTGDALLQFENDTMQNIEFTKHYNGEDIFNMAWVLEHDMPETNLDIGQGETSVDGFHFYNATKLKAGIEDKTITVKDNGTDMAYFNLGQIFSAEKTYMLRDKDLDVTVTLQDKDNAYRVYIAKWIGKPDKYTDKIITDQINDSPVLETNWELGDSLFISEDVLSGEHDFSGALTVPSDAVNFAVIIVPVVKQSPSTLKLKGFKIDVSEPFYGWILEAPELVGEKYLQFSERHAELRCDFVSGTGGIRYTLNDVPDGMPMPVGIIKSGKADIEIDHTINQVQGSTLTQFEGAIKFNRKGKATIQTSLYVQSELSHGILASTKFWYSKVSGDGQTFTKIPLSEYDVQVRGMTKAINNMPKFSINVEAGDRIALFATSDRADGAMIGTLERNVPMLKTVIDFNEITEEDQKILDAIAHADEITFMEDGKPAPLGKYKIEVDTKTGAIKVKEV